MIARTLLVAISAIVALVATAASASETWSCRIDRDTAPVVTNQTETIAVSGSIARLSSDAKRDYVVDRNDDEKLIASFADYGGKPPIRTVVTVVKASGDYSQIVTEMNRTLRSATGHCAKQ